MNAIFRADDVVLRVGLPNAPATASLDLARTMNERGIRVASPARADVVVHGDFSVTAWEHLEASGAPIDWAEVGSMVRVVHETQLDDVPADVPRPDACAFPWWDHAALLEEVSPQIDAAAVDGLREAMSRHDEWRRAWDDEQRDALVVCHGDVHPGNVMMSRGGPILIDWDLLCVAPPGWDHAALMTWADPWGGEPIYDDFARGYGWSAVGDRDADAFAELRLVSATLMRWKVAARNPAARPEAERRLAYWRGDPDARAWRAQ